MGNTESKLLEAEYFLTKIGSSAGGSQEAIFNLSACLTAARSVMDVLLYDYGIRYGLFTLSDRINASDFQRLATASGHADAVRFFNWWSQKVNYLANDPLSGFLSQKRHILVHRGPPPMTWSLILADTISFSSFSSNSFGSSFSTGNPAAQPEESPTPSALDVTAVSPATPANQEMAAEQRASLTGHFADYPRESIVDLCRKYLDMLSNIVADARSQFPL